MERERVEIDERCQKLVIGQRLSAMQEPLPPPRNNTMPHIFTHENVYQCLCMIFLMCERRNITAIGEEGERETEFREGMGKKKEKVCQ
jgi:hypothetical protein